MTFDNATVQILLYLVVLFGLAKPLGGYMARVYDGKVAWLGALERGFYRAAGIDSAREMGSTVCHVALAVASAVEPDGDAGFDAASGVQYGGEFYYQYQLAILWRGIDA